ncbi:MAG TPA: DUF4197 family protein, partial [Myxococcota bacterium]|nr:DUF4197 family protein [Myxococcota bacterium]
MRPASRVLPLLLALALPLGPIGCAELEGLGLGDVLAATAPLDQTTVAAGLKQALDVGTRRTTSTLSAEGGFGRNPALRLALPGELGQL